jgi:hypothetical protein
MKRLGFKLKEEMRFGKLLVSPQSLAQLYRRAVATAEQEHHIVDYHLFVSDNVSDTHATLKCRLPRKNEPDCPRDIAGSSCDSSLSLQTLLMAPKAAGLAGLPNKLLLVHDGKVSNVLDRFCAAYARRRAVCGWTPRTARCWC